MNMNQASRARVRLAVLEAARRWLGDPNVMLIDFGWPERGGVFFEDELAVRVHVVRKFVGTEALEFAIKEGTTRGPIPDTIDGFPVDRPQSGTLRLHQEWWGGVWRTARMRRADPMQGGISVSNAYLNGSGTLGGSVRDRESGGPMILSNWHVLAGHWRVRPGWPVCQPGRGDGGSWSDTVAIYSRGAMSFSHDAAVAKLTGNRPLVNHPLGLGPVKGVGLAQPGMEVVKSGRTTEVTYGLVTGIEGYAKLPYSGVYRLIRNVMTIVPRPGMEQVVSEPGDSGSLWLEEKTMHAVGLHFAGGDDPEYARAIDMQPVLDELNVDMVL